MFELGTKNTRAAVKKQQELRFWRMGGVVPTTYVCDECREAVVLRCPVAYEPDCATRCLLPFWARTIGALVGTGLNVGRRVVRWIR